MRYVSLSARSSNISRRLLICCVVSSVFALAQTAAAGPFAFTQLASSHIITVDGQFTDGVPTPIGNASGEWGDVQPAAFIASGGNITPTVVGDAAANSLLYAAVAEGTAVAERELYLMYDYLDRTDPFLPGEFVADIRFPINYQGQSYPQAVVHVVNGSPATIRLDGVLTIPASEVEIDVAFDFGQSILSSIDHLQIELEASLNISEQFANQDPSPPNFFQPGSGAYSPDPAFWGAFAVDNAGDPPISAAIFTLNPDGSLLIDPIFTPEPSAISLLGLGALGLLRATRRPRV